MSLQSMKIQPRMTWMSHRPSVICGQCGLMFSDELQCNSHMREHMHRCYKCNFESEREEVIMKHKNMEHKLLSCVNNSNESLKGMRDFFICEHCEGESFDEIRLLKKHEYDATGTISKCDDCDFASNDVPSIVEHVREAHKPVHQCHLEPQPVC